MSYVTSVALGRDLWESIGNRQGQWHAEQCLLAQGRTADCGGLPEAPGLQTQPMPVREVAGFCFIVCCLLLLCLNQGCPSADQWEREKQRDSAPGCAEGTVHFLWAAAGSVGTCELISAAGQQVHREAVPRGPSIQSVGPQDGSPALHASAPLQAHGAVSGSPSPPRGLLKAGPTKAEQDTLPKGCTGLLPNHLHPRHRFPHGEGVTEDSEGKAIPTSTTCPTPHPTVGCTMGDQHGWSGGVSKAPLPSGTGHFCPDQWKSQPSRDLSEASPDWGAGNPSQGL